MASARNSKLQVIRGSSLDIPLGAFDLEIDSMGRETSREPLDLTGAELCWVLVDCDGREAAAKTSAAGGIEILAPATSGMAIIHLLPGDLDLPSGEYQHEAWVVAADGRRGALIEPSPFTILPAEKRPASGTTQLDGAPASQSQAERTFSFSWPALGGQATVAIPAAGMLRDTYFVGYEFEDSALAGMLAFGGKTKSGFEAIVMGGGALLPGTKISFFVRDRG